MMVVCNPKSVQKLKQDATYPKPLTKPRDIYEDWPPNFDAITANSTATQQPQPPPPTPTSPRKRSTLMQRLRKQRRKRFQKKSPRRRQQQRAQQTTATSPCTPTPSPTNPPTNAPTIPTLSFPTPTNDIYAPNMKRMSLDMASDIPSPHLQQHDATGHTPPKNKKENN